MKIKELLSDESKWTKGWFARDNNNEPVRVNCPSAYKWCLEGAGLRCYGKVFEYWQTVITKINKELMNENIKLEISDWNDHPETKFQDIKALIEKLDI